ncbi:MULTISPECIES: flagellin [unclassified Neglectibacter]|uniref:flagellin N-terminal helical domain-containing protein n=1 Tax=unclassified Neglectibacter TaxID=2632164 RepID=UPI001EF03310|nr:MULTISPECIES: flagellin [unclassified Neglectibacter]
MRIQHNIMAMNAYRNYNTNTSALSKNLEKLSSGYKINRAGDDAAGLAISEKMRAQITGLNAAQKNVKDGVSLVKTAEGAMQEIQDMLNRMDYLATQSANGTYDNEVDRKNLQKEVDALKSEINRIADSANFNGIKLMDGQRAESAGTAVTINSSVSGTVTAGVAGGGGAISLGDANFTTANTDSQHAGADGVNRQDASFTIDLTGFSATAGTANETVSIKFGAITLGTVTIQTAGSAMNAVGLATSIADALSASTVNIGGVGFTVTNTGSTLVFTMDPAAALTSANAASVNELIGAEVQIDGTAQIDKKGVEHGAVDITEAVAAKAGDLAGIDFTITEDLMGQGKQLTIGDTTFVFQTEAGTTPDTTTVPTGTTAVVIDVSGKKTAAEQVQEAVRKIATAGRNIGHDKDGDGTSDATFNISSVGPNTIHLDQQMPGTGTPPVYSVDDMKGMFSAANPTTSAVAGSLELSPTISVDVAEGERVSFGDGKTYVIVGATSDKLTADIAAAQADEKVSEIYVTAESFNEELSKFALDKAVKDALADTAATGYNGSKLTAAVSNGTATITAAASSDVGVEDTQTKLEAFQTAVEAKLANFKVQKVTEDDIGNSGLKLQIGDTSDSFNQLQVKIGDMHTSAMGTMESVVEGGRQTAVSGKSIADINISTPEGAHEAIDVIKNAINYVSGIRGDLGATQNRLEHTANNLSVMAENIQDAESTIRDTDVAEEMMAYTKNNILIQSAQAMLAQANAVPQGVLQLLG